METLRVQRLRRLVAELERARATPQRDQLLKRARDRIVSIETGESPARAWRPGSPGELVLHAGELVFR